MRLKVLGATGAEFPGFHPPAFLLDGFMLLDAGTIGAVLDEKGLQDFCKGRLAVHKVPKAIRFLDELPKYQSGKVNKPALRKMAW